MRRKWILILIIIILLVIGTYFFIKPVLVKQYDSEILCPEFIKHDPVLQKISETEILLARGQQNESLKVGDFFENQYPHEGEKCTLVKIKNDVVTFECDRGCVMYCSGKYGSTFNIDIPFLKDIPYSELIESIKSGSAPKSLSKKYFKHEVYNCDLYKKN